VCWLAASDLAMKPRTVRHDPFDVMRLTGRIEVAGVESNRIRWIRLDEGSRHGADSNDNHGAVFDFFRL
jgi:hypothetical protein